MGRRTFSLVLLFFCALALFADERTTAARLEAIRHDPVQLRMFLQQMPKGGDLHNHLSGTAYAESFIKLAVQDGLCVDTQGLKFVVCNGVTGVVPASQALTDQALYTALVDAFSMRQFNGVSESGHDHFFATFGKFSATSGAHPDEMLAEIAGRFAGENVDYIETTFGIDLGRAARLGSSFTATDSYQKMYDAIKASPDFAAVISGSKSTIDKMESTLRSRLCGPPAKPGCTSTIRYLFETHRARSRGALFAELVVGFELAAADKRVVGVNSVQPEDAYASIAGFNDLMDMLAFLRPRYAASTHISLHAGELAPGIVPPEEMRYHIADSVNRARAERIGHGVDIAYETNAETLLRTMKEQRVAVEICLTSNDVILGVKGKRHPLRLYLSRGVPVVLATDDAGVSRIDATNEWQRAVEEHGLDWSELKAIARNSIEYSFLEGDAKAKEKARLDEKLLAFEALW